MRHWWSLNGHRESRFVGFDSFRGLPEDWKEHFPRGKFDLDGAEPQIDDPRCSFITGLFQDTLEPYIETLFSVDPDYSLIVNMDADLYSSTRYVLARLSPILGRTKETIIYFDEFRDSTGEFRAFSEFMQCHDHKLHLLVHAQNFMRVAFVVAK